MFQPRAALAWCLCLHLVEVMSRNPVDNFLRLLRRSPSGAVFNPWWEVDAENDIARAAPNHTAPTITRLPARTPWKREGRSDRRSGWLSRRSLQRNPDDF